MAYTVAVLTDGTPSEPGSSTESVRAVREALERAGHTVVDIACDEGLTSSLRKTHPDVAYIAAQGARGEDGGVQGLLELLGTPYVGSDATVCRRAWNKGDLSLILTKAQTLGDIDASMPYTLRLNRACFTELGASAALDLVEDRIPGGYPVCVKPACGGSARGVAKVETPALLGRAIEGALVFHDEILIQEWVDGVEVSVVVLGDIEDAQVLPPVEIVPKGRTFFDASCRATEAGADFFAPVRLSSLDDEPEEAQAIRNEIERAALDVYLACGARDLGRIDMVWDGARPRVLEVNLAPSMSPDSIVARACAAAGIDLAVVLDSLATIAVERGR